MSPSWWTPIEKMKSRLDGTRSGNPPVLGRISGEGTSVFTPKGTLDTRRVEWRSWRLGPIRTAKRPTQDQLVSKSESPEDQMRVPNVKKH